MSQKSVKKELSLPASIFKRLQSLAIENGYVTSSGTPNVPRFIRECVIKVFLDIERIEQLPDYKQKTGRQTPDIIRSSTYQIIIDEMESEGKEKVPMRRT